MASTSRVSIASTIWRHLERRPRPRLPELAGWSAKRKVEWLAAGCGARLEHGGTVPFYHRGEDVVVMPRLSFYWVSLILKGKWLTAFVRPGTQYAIDLTHELAHWSGHETRLLRPLHIARGDEIYRREECLAEMTSALLTHDLAITSRATPPHASYAISYLNSLAAPEVELDVALARANQVAGYLLALARSGDRRQPVMAGGGA